MKSSFPVSSLLSLFVFILLHPSLDASAQEAPKTLTAKFITEAIKLDGVLDEKAWETAGRTFDFWQFFPSDSIPAQYATEFRILYNETTLYVGVRAEAAGGNYVVSTLRRDFGATSNDNVSLLFDTFSDGANAFFFGVTPYGVQREGLVSDGGAVFNNTWDIKWQAQSKMYDDHYTVEIAIPFTSLKFREGGSKWRFRPYRWNIQSNEQSTWVRVPQNQLLSSLAFMGELVFEKPLGKSRMPFAVIPYINALTQKDFETDEASSDFKFGGDAKVSIGNGMNLDLTVNPDFSNVEVDNIVTNLTRFEISLPEKRQFFIDNNDLFGNFGSTGFSNPFFSRRIGIVRDTAGNNIENDILGGVRLSGKLNKDWRLGLLNLQTAEDRNNQVPSNNNSMLALQRRVFSRSYVGAFVVNRQTFGDYDFIEDADEYNRVVGLDFNLASADNVWTGDFYVHKSLQPGDNKGNISSSALLGYNTRNYNFVLGIVQVDEDFRADLGFVPRKDFFHTGFIAERRFYPKTGKINMHSFQFFPTFYWNPSLDYKKTDQDLTFTWEATMKNQAVFNVAYTNRYIYLTRNFDPTRTPGGAPLPAQKDYHFNLVTSTFLSNQARTVTYSLNGTAGQFFNGQNLSAGGMVSLRIQPKILISLLVNYDGIRLPEPHADAGIWLVSPNFDITFSKSLFWSTLIQYSNQRDNLGINSRLQWRFAPLSDLYLVYNDNYFTSHFEPRFRSINLKVSYWLNI